MSDRASRISTPASLTRENLERNSLILANKSSTLASNSSIISRRLSDRSSVDISEFPSSKALSSAKLPKVVQLAKLETPGLIGAGAATAIMPTLGTTMGNVVGLTSTQAVAGVLGGLPVVHGIVASITNGLHLRNLERTVSGQQVKISRKEIAGRIILENVLPAVIGTIAMVAAVGGAVVSAAFAWTGVGAVVSAGLAAKSVGIYYGAYTGASWAGKWLADKFFGKLPGHDTVPDLVRNQFGKDKLFTDALHRKPNQAKDGGDKWFKQNDLDAFWSLRGQENVDFSPLTSGPARAMQEAPIMLMDMPSSAAAAAAESDDEVRTLDYPTKAMRNVYSDPNDESSWITAANYALLTHYRDNPEELGSRITFLEMTQGLTPAGQEYLAMLKELQNYLRNNPEELTDDKIMSLITSKRYKGRIQAYTREVSQGIDKAEDVTKKDSYRDAENLHAFAQHFKVQFGYHYLTERWLKDGGVFGSNEREKNLLEIQPAAAAAAATASPVRSYVFVPGGQSEQNFVAAEKIPTSSKELVFIENPEQGKAGHWMVLEDIQNEDDDRSSIGSSNLEDDNESSSRGALAPKQSITPSARGRNDKSVLDHGEFLETYMGLTRMARDPQNDSKKEAYKAALEALRTTHPEATVDIDQLIAGVDAYTRYFNQNLADIDSREIAAKIRLVQFNLEQLEYEQDPKKDAAKQKLLSLLSLLQKKGKPLAHASYVVAKYPHHIELQAARLMMISLSNQEMLKRINAASTEEEAILLLKEATRLCQIAAQKAHALGAGPEYARIF